MQPTEKKLFSEKVFQNAILAAYIVRGLFLRSHSAYKKQFGFVHSYENEKFSENAFQNVVLIAYQVREPLSCSLIIE